MHHNKHPRMRACTACLVIAIPLFLVSCRPLRFTQDFDDTTERRLLQIQEKCSRFFIRMERQAGTPDASIVKYADFYEDVRVDIDLLRARNLALERTEVTQEQLDLLRQEIDQLEELHSYGFQDKKELKPLREGLEGTLVALQKYQLTLKNRIK